MIDMHSHILPAIDDGAKDVNEALAMLKDVYEKKCSVVIATPHLRAYSEEEIEQALEMRNKAYENVVSEAKRQDVVIPEIKLGFEVFLDKDITVFPSFRKLCIEGTDAMLVEMPMHHWDAFTLSRIDSLKENGIIPIIAHLDRYI
ncbi:MAG: exopolysaccharide biosynthesis protein, partial [Clostridia bacterium]|nr:exopolysaccharide biosynthesis protein [Clostridia bacterium]